eukprot:gene13293-biopygen3090
MIPAHCEYLVLDARRGEITVNSSTPTIAKSICRWHFEESPDTSLRSRLNQHFHRIPVCTQRVPGRGTPDDWVLISPDLPLLLAVGARARCQGHQRVAKFVHSMFRMFPRSLIRMSQKGLGRPVHSGWGGHPPIRSEGSASAQAPSSSSTKLPAADGLMVGCGWMAGRRGRRGHPPPSLCVTRSEPAGPLAGRWRGQALGLSRLAVANLPERPARRVPKLQSPHIE